MHVCMSMSMSMYMYIYIYIYLYMYMYMYMCMYPYTQDRKLGDRRCRKGWVEIDFFSKSSQILIAHRSICPLGPSKLSQQLF